MFLLNGKPLAVDAAFTANDIQYPANWLRLASEEERKALGITEVPDQVRPDDRFYWVQANPDGTFTATPKDLKRLKSELISQIKTAAGSMLSPTDWRVVRDAEGIKAIDAATKAKRKAVRDASDLNEQAVIACESVEELAQLNFSWPSED